MTLLNELISIRRGKPMSNDRDDREEDCEMVSNVAHSENEEDWQEDYATDTGSSAVCPKCQSTDIDHDSMPAIKQRLMAYYRVCQDCGHKGDWTGPDAGLASKRFGHPNKQTDTPEHEAEEYE